MSRGYAPVAVVLLLAVTVLAAGVVAVSLPSPGGEPPAPRAVAADATSDGRVALTLLSGPAVDVDAAALRLSVNGDALRHQPPVPYFAARGFYGTPGGPFNVAADPEWAVGETASLRIAGTNAPRPRVGDTVTVRVVVDGRTVATEQTTVEAPEK
ncbi:type IV pilin [Halobacterium yunchengense]|uniref:type IV pilin n=1 Tax=Halobacterium yunchengense TaxID=3108497 RepID=UPI00300A1E52